MFGLDKYKTNFNNELIAALTTFFTMSYILVVNSYILSQAGMDFNGIYVATAVAAAFGSILMGILANKPLGLASGMGLNAYFAYTAVLTLGVTWEAALAASFISSFLIFLIGIFRVDVAEAIPESFKHGLIAGLGLFLVFIGMQNAHFISNSSATIVTLGTLANVKTLIGVIGLFITSILVARKTTGALFIGILLTTIIGMVIGFTPYPNGVVSVPSGFDKVFLKLDFASLTNTAILSVIWTFFIISFFDILGTNSALLTKAGHVDKKGRIKDFEKTTASNGIAGMLGSIIGVPTVVTYLESATGIEAGGRTGLVAILVGLLFILSIFFFPLISAIPIEAAAPAMILTGIFMFLAVGKIHLDDYTESIPALIAIAIIPFTFSISNGIGAGSILYVFLKMFTNRYKEIRPAMYLIAILSLFGFAKIF